MIDNRLGALVFFNLSSPGKTMDVVLQDGETVLLFKHIYPINLLGVIPKNCFVR